MGIAEAFRTHLGKPSREQGFEDYQKRYREGEAARGLEPFARGGSGGRDVGVFGQASAPPTGSVPIHPIGGIPQTAFDAVAASVPRSTMSRSLGPAALQEVGPMFMNNRYGPGQLNHYGANLGGPGMGPGGAPTGMPSVGTGMAPAGGMPEFQKSVNNPFPGQGNGGGGPSGLEWAMLAATLMNAGGGLYGNIKAGQQRDREYDDQQRRLDEEDERRKDAGRVFGEAFRRMTRGG